MYREKDIRQLADEYFEEGKKAFEEKRNDEAIKLIQNAGKIYRTIKDSENGAEVLIFLGVVHASCGNDEIAVDLFLEALDIAEESGLDFMKARIYNNFGSRFHEIEDYEHAVYYYHLAEVWLQRVNPESEGLYNDLQVTVFLNMAQSYSSNHDFSKASTYVEKCKECFKTMDSEGYYYTLLLIQCEIDYGINNMSGIEERLDETIKGIPFEGNQQCYVENTTQICKLLANMSDFERWEKVLVTFGQYVEKSNDEYLMMINALMWRMFFKAKADIPNYQNACIEYADCSEAYHRKINKSKSLELTTKIDYIEFAKKVDNDNGLLDRDETTGVYNRVKFEKDFQELLIEGKTVSDKVGMGIVNLDAFQQLNDKYGHLEGDECLKKIADVLKEAVGEFGRVYRLGGDEFVLLLSNCSMDSLRKLAGEIKKAVSNLQIPNANSKIAPTLTVSQGYIYMRPERTVGKDALIKYATEALAVVRKKGRNDYLIVEEGKDYHVFYSKYIRNMEAAAKLETYYRVANDREEWLMNLKQRALKIQELFEDNERLIGHYLKPLFEGSEKLNDESATAIFEEISAMHIAEKREYVVVMQVAELLEKYFSERGMIEEHISVLIILLSEYKQLDHIIYYEKTMELYAKLEQYKTRFDEISKRNVRRQLCTEYFKQGLFIAENKTIPLRKCLDIIQENFKFFDENNLAENLRFSEDDEKYIKRQFVVQVLSANMVFISKQDKDNKDYKEAYEIISDIYNSEIEAGNSEFSLDARLIGAYYRCRWLLEEITLRDCFNMYKEYFYYTYSNPSVKRMDSFNELPKQRLFQLMIYYVPKMVFVSNQLAGTEDEVPPAMIDDILEKYVAYVKNLPKTGDEAFISKSLASSLSMIFSYSSDEVDVYDLLFDVIVERDVDITIHSKMVSSISKLLIEMIIRNNPSLLVGCLDFENQQQVEENWPEILKFIETAGMIHDIGKIDIIDITKTQTRRLNTFELDIIRRHPEYGAKMVQNCKEMKAYMPIILGHHKAWNDKDGYPSDYKYLEHPNPLLVNVIQLSDCIDAATDSIGRNYARTKTVKEVLKELHDEEGSRYNPDLVDLMVKDKKFIEDLEQLIGEGRQEICYELYNTYLK